MGVINIPSTTGKKKKQDQGPSGGEPAVARGRLQLRRTAALPTRVGKNRKMESGPIAGDQTQTLC